MILGETWTARRTSPRIIRRTISREDHLIGIVPASNLPRDDANHVLTPRFIWPMRTLLTLFLTVAAAALLTFLVLRVHFVRPEDGHTRAAEREARWCPLRNERSNDEWFESKR